MADRPDPKLSSSPIQPLSGRELARSPDKLESSPGTGGVFQSLPTSFGRFRVFRLLGHGAMGSVYLAFDPEIDKAVALKIPKADLAREPVLWERFQREARAAGDLNHAYICGMYEMGKIGPTHFFSMEYVAGRCLKDYISDRQPQKKVAGVVRKLALGLAHAHMMGIVHRDLKPANVMIDANGQPKLMDFGLVRRLDMETDVRATQPGVLIGSPGYMAPEQALAEHDRIGPKTDIYGLGVVLFELLTGSLPFTGAVVTVLAQIATQAPPRPSALRPDVDPQLEALCLRMLAKNPDDRPQSMAEVAQFLTAWLKSDGNRPLEMSQPIDPLKATVQASQEVERDEQSSAIENHNKQLSELLEQRRYSAAVLMLEKLRQPRDKPPDQLKAWAAEQLVKVRAEALANDPVAMAIRQAEERFRDDDYAGAARLLESIPAEERGRKGEDLLKKSITLRDECERLHRDIEQSIHSSDARALPEFVDELLKRQRSHPAAKRLADEIKRIGPAKVIANRRCEDVAGEFRRSIFHWKTLTAAATLVVVVLVCLRGISLASRISGNRDLNNGVESSGHDASAAGVDKDPKEIVSESKESVPVPKVELLDELIADGAKRGLWVSPDALRIYWERDKGNAGSISFAERSSTRDSFGKPESLFAGRVPTLSGDELTMVFTINDKLQTATRTSREQPFDSPHAIAELQTSSHVRTPSLTADGLHLVWFNAAQSKEPKKFWVSSRTSSAGTWSKPKELVIKDVKHLSSLSWPQLLDDGRTLLCNDESSDGRYRFVMLRRENRKDPFREPTYLEPPDVEGVFGRAAQYVPATDELYFLSPKSRELTPDGDGKVALKDHTEIFRLTCASAALGEETCEMISEPEKP